MKPEAENGKQTLFPGIQAGVLRLVRDLCIPAARASRDPGLHGNVLRNRLWLYRADPVSTSPCIGQQNPEQARLAAFAHEIKKPKAERDILKKQPLPAS